MTSIAVPNFGFTEWRRWSTRARPSQDFDVPRSFGILGLYLLAVSESDLSATAGTADQYLQQHVIYIGKSTHVEQRLERTHQAVARYRTQFDDNKCKSLWFSVWHSGWSNMQHDISREAIALASIALYERALILDFVQKNGRLPVLNRA